jgi:transcriptional regulator with XRE-family HTH domain
VFRLNAGVEYSISVETIHSRCHRRLVEILIAERKKAGMKQAQLAKFLGRSQTWVARMEAGRRRIDVVEFLLLAAVIGFNPSKVIRELSKIEK